MSAQALEPAVLSGFRTHNPDVLTCIANLSNDEVFTPPELANRMLDTLEESWAAAHDGASIWADSTVTFLDPFTKSGVFLREITRRLSEGLADEIPVLEDRVDHILTKQVYGIGITEITALLARRSLYCSKDASGEHSIAGSFERHWGNVWFERTEHTWTGGKKKQDLLDAEGNAVIVGRRCRYCGAQEDAYGRGDELETHAYAFIHTDDIKARIAELFGEEMQFDVIIGNPPYQLDDGGAGKSAAPIYHFFIRAAKALDPRFVTMITPSRWMAGGKGLDEFRAEMLHDDRIRTLVDFMDSDEAFPGVDIAGGVSYFLWDRDSHGSCSVTTDIRGKRVGPIERSLDEFDVFVRHAAAVSILKRVWPDGPEVSKSLGSKMSGRKAFGFATTARGETSTEGIPDPIQLISSAGEGFVARSAVSMNSAWIDKWKASVSRAAPAGGRPDKDGKYYGLSTIRVIPPGTITTEAYPIVNVFDDEVEAIRMCEYLRTRFVRFLLTLRAANQSITRAGFNFVPNLPMDQSWTDDSLAERYGLTTEERHYMESMVRPMEIPDA
ncbi:Eco57I restriction-modification methylase domain-containing protein [Microbacterium sp. ZXX196]|uniref:Eco57I restriction-modification methylase domain-containing protein n=1 Tax=Microbacterium sp. ZXX196 TaxID=2609291 RepID=UPI0012B843C8|nr:Eco57I restriction-modification methylase domain-containing protein [Microbacterium sp. ZXX196]MTE24260.1 restriction endonuclease [Microbacterium sp. ZXX196]